MFNTVVQSTIYAKLAADLVVPVYDDVPQSLDSGLSSAFPYVTIGEDSFTYIDTDDTNRVSVSIAIHTWSRYSGRSEIKELQDQIYNSLHRAEPVAVGFKFITITQNSASSFLDNDGQTRHGIQDFYLILEEL